MRITGRIQILPNNKNILTVLGFFVKKKEYIRYLQNVLEKPVSVEFGPLNYYHSNVLLSNGFSGFVCKCVS